MVNRIEHHVEQLNKDLPYAQAEVDQMPEGSEQDRWNRLLQGVRSAVEEYERDE